MDHLSMKFAREAALRQVSECQDVQELRALASTLVKAHFEAKALIETLMRQSLGLP